MINETAEYQGEEYTLDDILPFESKPYIKCLGAPYANNVYLNRNETMSEWLDSRGIDTDDGEYEWWID